MKSMLCSVTAAMSLFSLVLCVERVDAERKANANVVVSRSDVAAQGIIRQYVIDPRGEVQGFLLSDGTQVVFTSRVQREVIATMKPRASIRIEGRRYKGVPLMEPDAIINLETAASVQVPSHGEGPISPAKESLLVQEMRAEGSIEQFLYDRSGQIAGLILHDGTQVWLPPDVNDQFRHSLHMHDRLIVEGHGTENEYGRAMESLAIGIPGAPLTPLDHGTDGLEPPRNAPLGR